VCPHEREIVDYSTPPPQNILSIILPFKRVGSGGSKHLEELNLVELVLIRVVGMKLLNKGWMEEDKEMKFSQSGADQTNHVTGCDGCK
jgi:hypothetical protein